jgi:hypothetical protein
VQIQINAGGETTSIDAPISGSGIAGVIEAVLDARSRANAHLTGVIERHKRWVFSVIIIDL